MVRALCLLGVLAGFALAQDKEADAVLADLKSGKDLRPHAERRWPDAWSVADVLCGRGEHEAAEALARATGEAALGQYVVARRKIDDSKVRAAFREADAAYRRRDMAAVIAALDGVKLEVPTVLAIRAGLRRGRALEKLGRRDAAATYRKSGALAKRVGWRLGEVAAMSGLARLALRRRDGAAAMLPLRRQLVLARDLRDEAEIEAAEGNLGYALLMQGKFRESLQWLKSAMERARRRGDRAAVANTFVHIGNANRGLDLLPQAREAFAAALRLHTQTRNRVGVATALLNLGVVADAAGDPLRAIELFERCLKLDSPSRAKAHNNLAKVLFEQGDHVAARAHFERALAIAPGVPEFLANICVCCAEQGDRSAHLSYAHKLFAARPNDPDWTAEAGYRLGRAFLDRDSFAEAETHFERALKYAKPERRARVLVGLGEARFRLGKLRAAATAYQEAIELAEPRDKPGYLANLATVYDRLGEYSLALKSIERALRGAREIGHWDAEAICLLTLGNIYIDLGDIPRAERYYRVALAIREKNGDRGGALIALGNLGNALGPREAIPYYERARKLAREMGQRLPEAKAVSNLAFAYRELGEIDRARAMLESAARAYREMGHRSGLANATLHLSIADSRQGKFDAAYDRAQEAFKLAQEIGIRHIAFDAAAQLAAVEMHRGNHAEAVRHARVGVEIGNLMVRRIADEESAQARRSRAQIYETGLAAALNADDLPAAVFFLESGRAGALVEALGGRERVLAFALPQKLRDADTVARAAEAKAMAAHASALRIGKRALVRQRREELDAARRRLFDVAARVQREAKAAAFVYGKVSSLDEIHGTLAKSDVLVLYALKTHYAVAVVITSKSARAVQLGAPDVVRAAIRGFDPRKPLSVERWRQLIIDPLELPRDMRRLLVSPEGELAAVPFAMLGSQPVVYVPSATAYGILRRKGAAGDGKVLALGDPANVVRRLPGTKVEAERVGDVVLTGERATKANLRAQLDGKRWRAVHFACHGHMDVRRPLLSALALSDGYLTCLDVYGMRVNADLAVLSACDTARGKIYAAEGVIGFTRAFLLAGTPRVIVSLWKVDDDATRALMVKFYELWGEHDAATALRKAQAFVSGQPKWKQPHYWAAWQLWGPPD